MTQMETEPPPAAKIPQETVHQVTGQEALTFRTWVEEYAADF
ncbi:hypothetical protein [Nesterenkonia populi]